MIRFFEQPVFTTPYDVKLLLMNDKEALIPAGTIITVNKIHGRAYLEYRPRGNRVVVNCVYLDAILLAQEFAADGTV